MNEFTYCLSTEVIFGKNAENQTSRLIKSFGGHKVLVVYGGGSVIKSGLLEKIRHQMEDAGLQTILFGGAMPNPTLAHAREGIALARQEGTDFILGIGGGSSLDTAKAIAHGLANPEEDIWSFWAKEKTLQKTTPMGVILTIPAAGSETSDSAVLTNEETGRKCGLTSQLNRPLFAILNPVLASTLPPDQIGCGVADIMMHTLDRYFVPNPEDGITDALAEALLRTVIQYGVQVQKDPHNYKAMSEIMWCGSLSHNGLTGLGNKVDFAPHQLGHALSAQYGVAHGASLTAIWGSWARYVYWENPLRFARYAKTVWGLTGGSAEELALEGIGKTEAYFRQLGMPTGLDQLPAGRLSRQELEELAERCSYHKSRTIGSFVKLDFADILRIYAMANTQ